MEKTETKDIVKGDKKSRRDMIHFDYKNVELLKQYINPHARILNRRRTDLVFLGVTDKDRTHRLTATAPASASRPAAEPARVSSAH